MTQRILIAGSGFAGLWAALAAARARALAGREREMEITVISPEPVLHIRPRLYETALHELSPDVGALLAAVGVRHVRGWVTHIDVDARSLAVRGVDGDASQLAYDRFVLATGSRLFMPDIPGLADHAFNVDQLDAARRLDAHLRALPARVHDDASRTVVVAGGGFTGIETAAELPARLRGLFGEGAVTRVVLVERNDAVGPDLGPVPRPVIEEALAACGVEVKVGAGVAAIDAEGVLLENGERIATRTVIWTAGARANALAAQLPGGHDRFGRGHTDAWLHAASAPGVFVAGDVAMAATDDAGHVASMSCQHALSLGRVAGHNAAAELLGLPLHPYSQPKYVTCLDLGAWGAIFTEGWDRQVRLRGAEAKAIKREINTKWIYPPQGDRDAVFEMARPDFVVVA